MENIKLPPEAVEAAARAIYFAFTEINIGDGEDRWERLLPRYRAEYREQAEAALRAAINAWPGISEIVVGINRGSIILPLPLHQEAGDE